jgi:hypothetical protein
MSKNKLYTDFLHSLIDVDLSVKVYEVNSDERGVWITYEYKSKEGIKHQTKQILYTELLEFIYAN